MAPKDARASDATAWRAFADSESTIGPRPAARRAWHRGRQEFAVWIARVPACAIDRRVRRVQRVMAPWAIATPSGELHVTVYVSGFPGARPRERDDVPRPTLARQLRALALSGCASGTVVVGLPGSYRAAPFLRVDDPSGVLAQVRRTLAEALPVGSPPELRFAPFDPHVTLGRYRADAPTGPIVEALSRERDSAQAEGPIAMMIRSIDLVTFDPAVAGAVLTTRARVSLPEAPRRPDDSDAPA